MISEVDNRSSRTAIMSETRPPRTRDPVDPARWVEEHGDALFRYALVRLGDVAAAEDLVQETFLAALNARAGFAGQSSERTWMTGILKHKLLDYYRTRGRERAATDLDTSGDLLAELFDEAGKWRAPLSGRQADPSEVLERQEFWETFRNCLTRLPGRMAEAFRLREMDGMPSEEVQSALQVSANNLWVLLHRARLGLSRCLDQHWFGTAAERR
jgi:RNA polymerase sigma-70 factor (ECF subfamily)